MDEDEPPDWTLAEHLTAGLTALQSIRNERLHTAAQPICHHFWQASPADPMEIDVTATYRHLEPRFEALGVTFLPDRLEAWETVKPVEQWLSQRVAEMFQTAIASQLIYAGWTCEPSGRQPIGASMIEVINHRSE